MATPKLPAAPITFEKNEGQFPAAFRFVSRGNGLTLSMLGSEILFSLRSESGSTANVKMKFSGANPQPVIAGEVPAHLTTNYLLGREPAGWIKGVPSFHRVRMASVYPGIDLVLHGDRGVPEFDFEVAPGADPSVIGYRFEGADDVSLAASGDLTIRAAGMEFGQQKPVLYQTIASERRNVHGNYLRREPGIFGFAIDGYDRSAPLVIDPTVLYSKSYGPFGTGATGFAPGPQDNLYVVGTLPGGATLDTTATPHGLGKQGGTSDVFVARMDTAGNFVWVTYLGGSSSDFARAIVLDSAGAIYITGSTTSLDFPVSTKPFQKASTAALSGYLTKLDSSGANILYSTYLSGTDGSVYPSNLALEGNNLVVAGETDSGTFPTRAAGTAQPFQKSTGSPGNLDVFLSKLNADGSDLIFSTYLGGDGEDDIGQMIPDGDGNFIIAGFTSSSNFPTKGAGVITKHAGGFYDAFVTKVNATGTGLVFSTLLGGSDVDIAKGVAITAKKEILVAGRTSSKDFPIKNAFQPVYNGGLSDGFVTKLDANGVLLLSTYVGTAGEDYIDTISAQPNGPVLLSFKTDTKLSASSAGAPRPLSADSSPMVTISAESADDLKFQMSDNRFYFPGFSNNEVQQCGFYPVTDQSNIDQGYISYYCCAGYYYEGSTANSHAAQACLVLNKTTTTGNGIPDFLAQKSGGSCCDPVSTATGELTAGEPDLPASGPTGLHLERFYASQMKVNGFSGALGTNWTHNFEQRLDISGSTAVVTLFPGRKITFSAAGSAWQVAATEAYNYQLNTAGSGFKFADTELTLVYTFGADGKLTRIEDRNGNGVTVTQSPAGPASVTDGLGRTITFSYGGEHLIKAQDQAGRTVQFSYTGADLTSVTDILGQNVSYQYASGSPASLLISKTYPAGNIANKQRYDSAGNVTAQTSAGGNTTTFTYGAGNLTTVTEALGSHFSQTHSSTGALTQIVDNAGQATSLTYDNANRRASVTDRLGHTVQTVYDSVGGAPATYSDQLGNSTSFVYTTQAQDGFSYRVATQVVYADGATRRLTYDAKGNVLSITDPDGNKTQFGYDTRGWLTSDTNPVGGVTNIVNNPDGTVASVTLPTGDAEKYTYDDRKRLATTTHADGTQLSYTYNELDQPLTDTNEAGVVRTGAFGHNNSLTSQGDFAGKSLTTTYDDDNRQFSLTDRNGKVVKFAFDKAGRLQSATRPTGYQVTRNYDGMGRTISFSDAAGTLGTRTYDKEGHILSTGDGAGRATSFNYDAAGNLTKVSTPGSSSTFTYDRRNNITRTVNPASVATDFTYSAAGSLASVKRGTLGIGLTRDAQGIITGVTDPNGKLWTSTRDSIGRLASRKDPLGNTQAFQYDARQRLSKITLPDGTVAFSFDTVGRLLRQSYSDSTDLKFTYDKNGALLTANGLSFAYDAEERLINSNGIAIGRDDDGRIVSMTLSPAVTVTYTYNSGGMLSRVSDSKGGTVDVAYDNGRAPTSVTRSNGVVTTLNLDSAGQLASLADGAIATIAITRDATGNPTSVDRNLPSVLAPPNNSLSLAYDDASQLGAGKYDGEGRLASDGQRKYTWNLASHLLSYTSAAGSATFTYDALGMMISRSGGAARNYVANYAFGLPFPSIVRDGSNRDLRYYVCLPNGMPLYSIEAGDYSRRFYHYDEIGNTTFLTDDGGAVTDSYAITPYGEITAHTGSSENPFTFQGSAGVMQVDASSFYYMHARFYDGATGRFISRDPISRNTNPLSVNPYQYAEGNPVAKLDPSGMDTQTGLFGGVNHAQWSVFQNKIAENYLGQEVVTQIIQDAFKDITAINAKRCPWWYFGGCDPYKDPAIEAAKRLQAVLGPNVWLGDGLLPDSIAAINKINFIVNHDQGKQAELAKSLSNLFGPNYLTVIGQDAESQIRQANMLPSLSRNNTGVVANSDAARYINRAFVGLITNDGGSVVSHDGASVVSHDGASVVSHDGASFTNLLMGLISQDGGGVVSHDGASFKIGNQ